MCSQGVGNKLKLTSVIVDYSSLWNISTTDLVSIAEERNSELPHSLAVCQQTTSFIPGWSEAFKYGTVFSCMLCLCPIVFSAYGLITCTILFLDLEKDVQLCNASQTYSLKLKWDVQNLTRNTYLHVVLKIARSEYTFI